MQGGGRSTVSRPSRGPVVNPWANPYLPFAQRLAATVRGSWAGTLPLPRFAGVAPFNNGFGNGWQQSVWPALPQALPAFSGEGYPLNAYPWYGPPTPIYAPPPPLPLSAPIPLTAENIPEPTPSVRVSDRHAIGRAAEQPIPGEQLESNQEYPAVVELRNGSVYTVANYWVKGREFHFITTRFDHYQLPFADVGRISPKKGGPAPDPMLTATPSEPAQRRAPQAARTPRTSSSSHTKGALH